MFAGHRLAVGYGQLRRPSASAINMKIMADWVTLAPTHKHHQVVVSPTVRRFAAIAASVAATFISPFRRVRVQGTGPMPDSRTRQRQPSLSTNLDAQNRVNRFLCGEPGSLPPKMNLAKSQVAPVVGDSDSQPFCFTSQDVATFANLSGDRNGIFSLPVSKCSVSRVSWANPMRLRVDGDFRMQV